MGHKILLFLALITTVVITPTIANDVLKTFQSMAAKGLTIFTVDKVLLPKELFGKSPSPAPVLAPSPVSEAPSPIKDMLPAPSPMETPSTSGSENCRSDNGADHMKGSAGMAVLITGCATLISSFILS
uniref:Uncharacterized protein n=1 Tax=Quercus lobata TaxID=97700 RepID=A0A7N2N5T2_QUELO